MSLAEWSFLRPLWLLALLPLAGVLWFGLRARITTERTWLRVVDAHLLPHLLIGGSRSGYFWGWGLWLLAGGLLILALAGPVVKLKSDQADETPARLGYPDVVRVVLLDLSETGESARHARWRLKLADLLRASTAGETALIAYAGEPYLIAPPTRDVDTLLRFVPELSADVLPVAGNRPERAFALAAEVLARRSARQLEVVWLTSRTDLIDVPKRLRGAGLIVWHDPSRGIAMTNPPRQWGEVVSLRPDMADIRYILSVWQSRASGLVELPLGGASQAVDLGPWLLLAVLPIAVLAFRPGLLAWLWVPLVGMGGLTPGPAQAGWSTWWQDAKAWHYFQRGDLAEAAQTFTDPRWQAVARYRQGDYAEAASLLTGIKGADADVLYNHGNALARQGKLVEALAMYESALRLRAGDADIRHNRDLLKRLLNPPPQPPPPSAGTGGKGGKGGGAAGDASQREADQVAAQWQRQAQDEPGELLRARLRSEQRRRQAGEVRVPW